MSACFVAPAIVLTSADLKDKPSSLWDVSSLDGDSVSNAASPSVRLRSKDAKNNQMIKNTMPSMPSSKQG